MNWVEQSPLRGAVDLPACGDELRLGFLGWVERSKGIFDLLEAMAALRGRGRRVFLEVAGYGGGFAVAQKRVEELGIADAVRFSGWLSGPEKLRFLSECHVLVLPSYGEGLPNAMLEAMAAGRPVIATNVGGIPDVLAGSGAGILHEPGDVPALVAAIETYYEDRSILVAAGAKARTIALRDHAIENAARRLRDCLLGRGAEVT
jgi:glycosyltransferase involved in cell wall biosynthesis